MGIMTSMLTGTGTVTGDKADCSFATQPSKPNEDVLLKDTKPSALDQCGFENDGIIWVKNEPPKRKRVCEEPPEKQAKYRDMLKLIFSPVHSIINRRVSFDPEDVLEICCVVQPYLESEPMFIEDIEPPITIIGDLHGQFHDLSKIFTGHSVGGKPGYECARYIFLGNYVDKGRQSLEVVLALYLLKILYPSEFFLLRGNHEFLSKNRKDLFSELEKRYHNEEIAVEVWAILNATFEWLSLCAIVGGDTFCVHGGISKNGLNRRSLRNLRKPIRDTKSYLVQDLVTSDPADGLQGTAFNVSRGSSILFGEDAFALAMDAVDCLVMFRGHSRITDGCEVTWDRCYTVYSAPDVSHSMNKGSFAKIDKDGYIQILIMNVDPVRHRLEVEIKKMAGEVLNNEDLGTGTITKMG